MEKELQPAFTENNIPIILSSDDTYSKYLSVSIQSIIENTTSENNYDIVILDGGILQGTREKIESQRNGYGNVSIRFVNMDGLLSDVDVSLFFVDQWFSVASYFRFFIPRIMHKYKKSIYMDCDILLDTDIAEFYNLNLNNMMIGAVQECSIEHVVNLRPKEAEYYLGKLGLKDPRDYFNSGFLLLDIEGMIKNEIEEKLFESLKKIKHPRHCDQCVLNSVFNGSVQYLDFEWNFMPALFMHHEKFCSYLSEETYFKYMKAQRKARVIHYAGCVKPWQNRYLLYSDLFWLLAAKTPFFEELEFEYRQNASDKILKQKKYGIAFITELNKRKDESYKKYRVKIFGITVFSIKLK